jgi:hypothetical protein
MTESATAPNQPWWKFGHVWMVVGGPALVVVAAIVTGYIAFSNADQVVDSAEYQKILKSKQGLATNPASLAPANQGRNHAATGVPQEPKKP